jgi:hypothetical protein
LLSDVISDIVMNLGVRLRNTNNWKKICIATNEET